MGYGESKLLQKFSAITYELDIGQRLTAFDRDGSLHDMLQIIWPHLEPKLDSVIDSFLETLMSFDEVQGRIEDATDTIRARQREFWEIVFTRPIDMTYGQMISERGVFMHQRGILPRCYLPAYARIFEGMLTAAHTGIEDADTLGKALTAINNLNFMMSEIMLSTQHELVRRDSAEALRKHGEAFESDVVSALTNVTGAAERMRDFADQVSASIADMQKNSATVTDAANTSVENVRQAAGSAEQLADNYSDMSRQIQETAGAAEDAQSRAAAAKDVIQSLSGYSEKIGDVIKLIDDIAARTNLLALNATIEAARAGEAGRGFAVVAGEVKALAGQTAKATGEISEQIQAVQGATGKMVEANSDVREAIQNVVSVSKTIAGRMDEQSGHVNEISRSVSEAARRSGDVSATIGEVSTSIGSMGESVRDVGEMAREVFTLSEQLSQRVDRFLAAINAESA